MDRSPEASKSEGTDVESRGESGSGNRAAQPGTPPRQDPSSARAGEPGISVEPTEAEIEAWAASVRRRRQAWLDGPTEEEKHEWHRRERARRLARLEFEAESQAVLGGPERRDPYEERRRLERRYLRDTRLAAEGLGILVATLPFRALATLVAAGQECEDEYLRPARRRWIPFYDDDV
jgi:hypothetical protein